MMDTNMQLYEKLTKIQWLLQKSRFHNRSAAGPMADVSRGQGRILALLKLKDGISTKDLSYMLGIRISSLNELLAKLEKNGFIRREQSESDKRIMLIKLTQKGSEMEQSESSVGDIFHCLSQEEQATFGEYLDRIIASLESELEEHDNGRFEEARRQREEAFEKFFNGQNPFDGFHDRRSDPHGFHGFDGFGPGRHPGFNRFDQGKTDEKKEDEE